MKHKALALWLSLIVLLSGLISFRLYQLSTQPQVSKIVPTCTPHPHRPDFQTGVVFPQWGVNAYSNASVNWKDGMNQIAETHACWISMTLPFHMTGPSSTSLETRADTPTIQAFQQGVQSAHRRGYRVLVEPLVTLDGQYAWAGYVTFPKLASAKLWFDHYAQILAPYIAVASEEHAEEFSLGNEFDLLDMEYPSLWRQLLDTVHKTFAGPITYGFNWGSIKKKLPTWFDDPLLSAVGISCYFPVTPHSLRLDQQTAVLDWRSNIQSRLDTFSETIKKPLLLTEIGYINTANAGYQPWKTIPDTAQDNQEQAILYEAAMENISTDPHIQGTFWWAWSMPHYDPNGKPAAQVLQRWYNYL